MKTVAIGISGGVDSAVAAALLKQQGFNVLGVFLWCYQTRDFPCTTDQDRAMAVRVCHHLDIPIKILDLRKEYKKAVIDYFFSEYKAGRTPNPDVVCNKEIKFGLFYKKAIEEWGMDYVGTGHYSRIFNLFAKANFASQNQFSIFNDKKKRFYLAKGLDDSKDQSYFLYTLNESQLEHILFPIGDYKKEQVRKMAKQFNLPNGDRPDSQGICFVGEVDIRKFLSSKLKVKSGPVVNIKGEVIGEHEGVWFYTIGQRHGFRIGSGKWEVGSGKKKWEVGSGNERKPLYVLGKNSQRNELVVGEREECFRKEFEIEKMHWINGFPFCHREARQLAGRGDLLRLLRRYAPRNDKGGLQVRIRHLGEMYNVSSVIPSERSESRNLTQIKSVEKDPSTHPAFGRGSVGMTMRIILDKPAFAVAPGQSAVIYNKDIILGGGIINGNKTTTRCYC